MRAFIGILALSVLVAVAVGGPFAMAHGLDHDSGCFLATVADTPCLTVGTLLDHMATLQRMLLGLPAVLAVVLLAAMLTLGIPSLQRGAAPEAPSWSEALSFDSLLARAPVHRWHARLTHSPTLA